MRRLSGHCRARTFPGEVALLVAIALAFWLRWGSVARAATVIDFEDQKLAFGTGHSTPPGIGVVTAGFLYSPGPNNNSGSNELRVSNAEQSFSYNGTTVCFSHDDGVLTTVSGAPFFLEQFDFAGFPNNKEAPFSVFGVRADGTTITNFFIPDGIVDGIGGRPDFQPAFVVGDWTNLVSVTWTQTGPGTDKGVFALDNIYVGVLPEPASIALAAIAAAGWFVVAVRQRRRRRCSACPRVPDGHNQADAPPHDWTDCASLIGRRHLHARQR